jgi:hypothetical protein
MTEASTMNRSQAPDSTPEIHLFLLWSNALGRADDILEDIRSRFSIRDVFSVEWTREHFAQNLTRFYGQLLPAGSEKEIHCGVDAFLVVVVEDATPIYAARRTSRGKMQVNARMFDAKKRYRHWTGGGHRVHATLNPLEADKDLFLLLGRRASFYETASDNGWDGTTIRCRADLVGATEWKNHFELLNALEASVGCVAISRNDWWKGTDPERGLTLLVGDVWWAARIANGEGDSDSELSVRVAGRACPMRLREVGDGTLDPLWQRTLLARAVRNTQGVLIPGPVDRFYLTLSDIASRRGQASPSRLAFLDATARQHSLLRGDYADPSFARAAVDDFLLRLHADESVEPVADGRKLWRWLRRGS